MKSCRFAQQKIAPSFSTGLVGALIVVMGPFFEQIVVQGSCSAFETFRFQQHGQLNLNDRIGIEKQDGIVEHDIKSSQEF